MAWATAGILGAQMLASALSSSSASQTSKKEGDKQYERQKALMLSQQNWLERMSNTAHQREVADLKSAGLNPILSANNGASTPSAGLGSTGISGAGEIEQKGWADGINAGINWKNAESTSISAHSQQKLNNAQIEKIQTEQSNIAMDTEKKQAETTRLNLENKWIDKETKARIDNMATQTAVNNARVGEVASAINLNKKLTELKQAEKELTEANTKRTKDLPLGQTTESWSGGGLGTSIQHTTSNPTWNKHNTKFKTAQEEMDYYQGWGRYR